MTPAFAVRIELKAVLILANDAQANHEAYIEERSTRLADSSNYVFAIEKLKQSVNEQKEALKLCLAMPKEIIIKNPDWWKWFLGGTVTGAVIYFVVDNFLIKK